MAAGPWHSCSSRTSHGVLSTGGYQFTHHRDGVSRRPAGTLKMPSGTPSPTPLSPHPTVGTTQLPHTAAPVALWQVGALLRGHC